MNPLTNSDIIGVVEYYLVKPKQAIEAVVVEVESPTKKEDSSKDKSIISSNLDDSVHIQSIEPSAKSAQNQSAKLSLNDGTRASTVLKSELGQSITQHSVQYEDAGQRKVVPPLLGFLGPKARNSRLTNRSPVVQTSQGINRSAGLTITTKGPTIVSLSSATSKSAITPGRLTRFNNPVPEDEPQFSTVPRTKKGQRRSLSYANAVSATDVPLSFQDWTAMIQRDSKDLKSLEKGSYEGVYEFDYDLVTPSMRQFVRNDIIEEDEEDSVSPSHSEAAPVTGAEKLEPEEQDQITYLAAVMIATDEDFLEQSSIRKLFKDNALSEEDAKLFEMPEFTGKEEEQAEVEIVGDDLFCDCCFPTRASLEGMSPLRRFFHLNKCVIFVILIVMLGVGFAFMLVYLRPQQSLVAPSTLP